MIEYENLYIENKKLDDKFNELYKEKNADITEKNIVELLVELGELANETRCFKYWSQKGSSDKEIVIEEFADCLLMSLCFCNTANVDLKEEFNEIKEQNIINQFKKLYNLVSSLDNTLEKNIVKEILANIDNLGSLLNFSRKEIIEASMKKIKKNFDRFETNY